MAGRDSRPDMGALTERIDSEAGAPVERAEPSDPPPPDGARVNPEKLRRGWEMLVAVLRQLIREIELTRKDNALTRRDAFRTRVTVVVSVLLGVAGVTGSAYIYAAANNALLQEIRDQQADMRIDVANNRVDIEATLRAVRAVSEAVGAKIEADAAENPVVEEAARKKAVEAQEQALGAVMHVDRDPDERAKAAAKLETLRRRVRIIDEASSPLDLGQGAPAGAEE